VEKEIRKIMQQKVSLEKTGFWKIFMLQVLLFFIVYGIMLVPRFSTDSYSVYFYTSESLDGFLTLGRIGTFFLYKILLALGVNTVTMSPAFTAVFCLAISWSTAVFLNLLKPYFTYINRLILLNLGLAALLIYANIYFAELFFFSDVALVYTLDIVFMTLALQMFFHSNKIVGMALSFVFLCCSLSFYQASLGIFMSMSFALIAVRHDVLWTKQDMRAAKPMLQEFLWLLAVGGAASVTNVLGMKLLESAGFYTNRSPSLNLADILDSLRQIFQQFRYYYSWGYPNYVTGLLKIILIMAGPVLIFLLADSFDRYSKKRYPLLSLITTLLVIVADFLLVFAPHFLSQKVWLAPRSICAFFSVFSFIAVVTSYNHARHQKSVPLSVLTTLSFFVFVNIVVIQCIAMDQIRVNQSDKLEASEIVRCIQAYEEESGQTVEKILWHPDDTYTQTYPEIRCVFMDMNVKASARSWSLADCISYYAGRKFHFEQMQNEIRNTYFQWQNWDTFQPDEQIRFHGNTMYLMVY